MVQLNKEKEDLAVYKVMLDLHQKRFYIFNPISEGLPFDKIAYRNGRCYRLQIKYCADGKIKNTQSWSNKHGTHYHKYDIDEFDYYALYLPEKDIVIYPSIKFGGKTIRTKVPKSATQFYWYEDFFEFTDNANKRIYSEFSISLTRNDGRNIPLTNLANRKVSRPSKEELQQLVWETPTIQIAELFGVSDKAISNWCKAYSITKPPRGYWMKSDEEKLLIKSSMS